MKRTLFLQGPLGSFFKQVAQYFHTKNHQTFKINFNGGDRYYAWADQIDDYTDTPEQWSEYLTLYIKQHKINAIIVYGDCRFYHVVAAKVAKRLNVDFWVCEEGYLRAGFVTFEKHGCNANSRLNLTPSHIETTNYQVVISSQQMGNTFLQRAIAASLYYWQKEQYKKKFKRYRHHRPWSWLQETLNWLNNFKQKFISAWFDPLALKRFNKKYHKQFFLVPLQVNIDFQITEHSPFANIEESIRYTIESFALHANKNDALLIKHHPQARGFIHYGKLIKELCQQFNISERVLYIHKAHLPTIYHYCKGVVTVNSTVGLSAILHHLPTITLGKAIYNIPGLTYQDPLDQFWQSGFQVNDDLFQQFHGYLQAQTQIEGDFYKPSHGFISKVFNKVTLEKTAKILLAYNDKFQDKTIDYDGGACQELINEKAKKCS
jgi:capsular polysaccharide export protein